MSLNIDGKFEIGLPLPKRMFNFIQSHPRASRREVMLSVRFRHDAGLDGSYDARRKALDNLVEGGLIDLQFASPELKKRLRGNA